MIIIHLKGPAACGKTTMANFIREATIQEGTTWREKLAWWLLKKSWWNRFKFSNKDICTIHEATPKAISNLRERGVKLLIVDGD